MNLLHSLHREIFHPQLKFRKAWISNKMNGFRMQILLIYFLMRTDILSNQTTASQIDLTFKKPSRRFVLKLYYMLSQRRDLQKIWGWTEASHCKRATSLCSKPTCVFDDWTSQWISTHNSCWLLAGGPYWPCAWPNGASPIFIFRSKKDIMTLSFIVSICVYVKAPGWNRC